MHPARYHLCIKVESIKSLRDFSGAYSLDKYIAHTFNFFYFICSRWSNEYGRWSEWFEKRGNPAAT